MTVIAVIVQAMATGALYLSRSSSSGRWKTRVIAGNERAARSLSNELRLSSTEPDLLSGQPRFAITGPEGNRELGVSRVVDFADNGTELIPVWSTWVTYKIEGGWLVREQDGQTERVLNACDRFEASVDGLGRFVVEVGVSRNPGQGPPESVRTQKRITPMF